MIEIYNRTRESAEQSHTMCTHTLICMCRLIFAVHSPQNESMIPSGRIRSSKLMILSLFYLLVVNEGNYFPEKGNVRENNEYIALVIFADLSLLWQIFPQINHTLIK